VLRLNDDPLPKRRADAYESYTARLKAYVHESDPAARERQRRALQRLDHPTVWREMKRQRRRVPALRGLFEAVREALAW
jgi:hypothetical protein